MRGSICSLTNAIVFAMATAPLVYQILIQYWDSTPEEDVRPLLVLVSD